MKILLLLPLLLGFSVPAIAHNEFNGGDAMHSDSKLTPLPPVVPPFIGGYMDEEGEEGPNRENIYREDGKCFGICY